MLSFERFRRLIAKRFNLNVIKFFSTFSKYAISSSCKVNSCVKKFPIGETNAEFIFFLHAK